MRSRIFGISIIGFLGLFAVLLSGCLGATGVSDRTTQVITDLRVMDFENRTQIVVGVERKLDFTYFSLDNPPRLMITLVNTSRGVYANRVDVGKGDVLAINLHDRRNPHPAVQLEILLTRFSAPEVQGEENRLLVSLPRVRTEDAGRIVENYRIGPEDSLEIQVWKNKDLSRQATVRPDGKVSLPLVGDVQASGLTTGELEKVITDRLAEFVEAPHVSVLVAEVNSYFFYITGEVAKPGKYPIKGHTTLLQAVSMAGGFTPFAARNKISVFRKEADGGDKIIRVKYDEILSTGDAKANIALQTGDTIVVP